MAALTLRLRKLPGVRAWAVVDTEPGCYECSTEEYLAFGKTAKLAWRHYVEKEEACVSRDPSIYDINRAQVDALFSPPASSILDAIQTWGKCA